MNKNVAKTVSLRALSLALVCLGTMVIQIPIPLGYAHLGDAVILLVSVFWGPAVGGLAGGLGSALADLLTGYAQWVPTTLLTKALMGALIGWIAGGAGKSQIASVRTLLAAVAGILEMIAGYWIGGSILAGSMAAGAAQIPGLALKGVFAVVLFYAAGFLLEKAHVDRLIRNM